MKIHLLLVPGLILLLSACASDWKIQGGPQSCIQMCKNWGLEFSAMVGVGDQSKYGGGATACVCQPKRDGQNVSLNGVSGSSAGMSAPINAIEAANAAAAAQAAQMLKSNSYTNTYNSYPSAYKGYSVY